MFSLDVDAISQEPREKHSILPTPGEVGELNDALNDCWLDRCFKQVEKYKELTLANINEIAEIYEEDNVAALEINSPVWMVNAFEDNEG